MRVLMLGWEFPPFISGGLGTACHGLTRGLSRHGVEVLFVLPKAVDGHHAEHVQLRSPADLMQPGAGGDAPGAAGSDAPVSPHAPPAPLAGDAIDNVTFRAVPSAITSPYLPSLARTPEEVRARGHRVITTDTPQQRAAHAEAEARWMTEQQAAPSHHDAPPAPAQHDYTGDVVADAQRYAELCLNLVAHEPFDVIHAHDWMTYPAGMALAAATGRPLVVHVHSTEYDRGGEHGNAHIRDIERRGMHAAMLVICVSHLTRKQCVHRYGVPDEKLRVVYNGIETGDEQTSAPTANIERGDKIVLFLGRITMQKGPEFFVDAAKKVLSKVDRVKFVMAGSGDMVPEVMRQSRELGIAHKMLFTGFLRGRDVSRVFEMADVYVMPSVSEPFGIAPLEAIRHDVPVIISRNSGVAEVLHHALKVDPSDTNDIADKIIAVLRHAPLSRTLREHADLEVRKLTWDGAAGKCIEVYDEAIHAVLSGSTRVAAPRRD